MAETRGNRHGYSRISMEISPPGQHTLTRSRVGSDGAGAAGFEGKALLSAPLQSLRALPGAAAEKRQARWGPFCWAGVPPAPQKRGLSMESCRTTGGPGNIPASPLPPAAPRVIYLLTALPGEDGS